MRQLSPAIFFSGFSIGCCINEGVICYQLELRKYCIAGNFRGRTFSWILQFCGYLRKFSPQSLGAWHPLERQKQAIRESFLCENCTFHQFVKVFSLESFPLYSTWYSERLKYWYFCSSVYVDHHFIYLWKFSPWNLGAWCLLAWDKRANCESFLRKNRIFSPICETILPRKFPTVQ